MIKVSLQILYIYIKCFFINVLTYLDHVISYIKKESLNPCIHVVLSIGASQGTPILRVKLLMLVLGNLFLKVYLLLSLTCPCIWVMALVFYSLKLLVLFLRLFQHSFAYLLCKMPPFISFIPRITSLGTPHHRRNLHNREVCS